VIPKLKIVVRTLFTSILVDRLKSGSPRSPDWANN